MKQRIGSTGPFPAAIYEFASTQNLGIPLSEHRWGISCLEAIWMPIVGMVIIEIAYGLYNMATLGHTPFLSYLPSYVILMALLIVGLWYFIECFRRRSTWRVYVFTDGFAYFKGRKREVFRWEEVRHIKEGITYNRRMQPIFHYYRVEPPMAIASHSTFISKRFVILVG